MHAVLMQSRPVSHGSTKFHTVIVKLLRQVCSRRTAWQTYVGGCAPGVEVHQSALKRRTTLYKIHFHARYCPRAPAFTCERLALPALGLAPAMCMLHDLVQEGC